MKVMKNGLLLLAMAVVLGLGIPRAVSATETVTPENNSQGTVSGSTITEPDTQVPEVPDKEVKPVKPAKISRKFIQLKKGKTAKISVSNYKGKITWSSTKTKVAGVSKNGKVTAKAPGETTIIAKAGDKQLKCKVRVVAQTKYVNQWVEKNGRIFYYNKYGVKSVGKKTIKGKTYYFDGQGRQRVGWVKSKGKFYFYQIAKKSKGYQVTGKKINGIQLTKTGEAKLTKDTKNKVQYLTDANDICFDYTNSNMSKQEALKKMYTLLAKGEIISYQNYGGFKNSKNWDQHYAAYYFDRGIGDCYTAGCAFAYMATALGYQDVYAVSSGGHGWCKIGNKYYDPNWGWWGTNNMYDAFASSGVAKGKNGTMNWKKFSKYLKKVS